MTHATPTDPAAIAAFLADLPAPVTDRTSDVPRRRLGRADVLVSAIGLGGAHVARIRGGDAAAVRLIRAAVDGGITFLDNSWDYAEGVSEQRMGKALKDGYRDRVFLMTKIDGRTKKEATRQLDQSLRRLKVDHVDLLQHHEILRMDDADRIFAPGGAHEAIVAAKEAGKIRFAGFTGHKDPLVHLRMLDVARENDWIPDTVQMPLNVLDAHFRSFALTVLPRLVREGIAPLGMKPLAEARVVASGAASAIEALHYALSLPTSVVITGIDKRDVLKQAFEAAKTFVRYDRAQLAALLTRSAAAAKGGQHERFKISPEFDMTMVHPEFLGDVHEV